MSNLAKIRAMLTPAERKNAAVLLGFMVIGMALETFGVGLVLPVISLLTQPDLGATYPALRPMLRALGNPGRQELIVLGMTGLVAVYLVKALFLGFLAWRQSRFAYGIQRELSQRLFTTYLRQPYTFHLQRNSAQLIRNIVTEVSLFTANAIMPTMQLLTEGLVLVGIAALLLAVEPVGALVVVFVLGGLAWVFHQSTRARVARWGKTRQQHEGLRIQHLQQGLGGARDVKLLGREDDFLAQFAVHTGHTTRAIEYQSTLLQLSRLWLELLAVAGLATLVASLVMRGRDINTVVPILALFGAAAFRLLPSVNRVLAAMQARRYGLPVIGTLYDELQLAIPDAAARGGTHRPGFARDIRVEKLTYSYQNAPGPALRDVSFAVSRGETVGFIGPSGSGKSTLVDVVLGLLTPGAGRVLVDGQDIQHDLRAWQDQIGYVPQSIYLTDDTLRRNVAFGLADDRIDNAAVSRAIAAAQLQEFVDTLPNGVETVVGERGVRLSGGQRQRIGIARALYHDPSVLVLDEATSALDTATERGVMESVMALHGQKTILIVAHRLSTVEHCDRVYRLESGKIVAQGATAQVLAAT